MLRALLTVSILWMGLSAARADEGQVSDILSGPGETCIPPAQVAKSSEIEVGRAADEGVAPADLPGSALDVTAPDVVSFPFFVDPLLSGEAPDSAQPGLTARDRAGASLYLGDVHYNKATGAVTLGDAEISAPPKPCP